MILERLKLETADLHLATEAAMPFGDPGFDRTAYIALLKRTRGFFRTWEACAAQIDDPATLSLVRERSRLDALARDLAFFHESAGYEEMPADYLPSMCDAASLLGSMYVVEGSTLGGQLIARMLETKLNLSEGQGYSFFVGAGPATGARWKAFGRHLTEFSNSHPSACDAVIAAARKTFEAYGCWVGRAEMAQKVCR